MPVPGLRKRQRETHHYSSHTGMFTQGCGLTEKTFQPWQLSFFKTEARQRPCDITPIESRVDFYKVCLRCQISLKLLFHHNEQEILGQIQSKSKNQKREGGMVVIWWKKTKGTFHFLQSSSPPATDSRPTPISCVCGSQPDRLLSDKP